MNIQFVEHHSIEAPSKLVMQYPELLNNYPWTPHPIKHGVTELSTIDPHVYHSVVDSLKKKGIPFSSYHPARGV